MPALTSAAGLVGFLSEPDPALQAFALETLDDEIDSLWPEVSGSIGQMYVYFDGRARPWSYGRTQFFR
jgi:26S proteasome regulatory subunit N2